MQPPIVLSIAGSDPSGGAGIQADLKTFTAFDTYGAAVIAGLTVQNTQGVRDARALDPEFVVAQIEAVFDDLPVAATKIGMLTDAGTAQAVAALLERRRADAGVVVLDPVMVATSGDRLLSEDATAVIRDRLTPLSDLVTPNLPEAAVLLGTEEATDLAGLEAQAQGLLAVGAKAALVKGGHLTHDELTDVFADAGGPRHLTSQRIDTPNTHGTGCTMSSAIAACAALAGDTPDSGISFAAVERAHAWLARAIRAGAEWSLSRNPQTSHGPVNHLTEEQA